MKKVSVTEQRPEALFLQRLPAAPHAFCKGLDRSWIITIHRGAEFCKRGGKTFRRFCVRRVGGAGGG